MAKDLGELKWVEELLPKDYLRKHMFGGFAYYVNTKLVLAVFEGDSSKVHNKVTYPFAVWNGCLFPVERIHHQEIHRLFPFLVPHPVLPKWMYLPAETEDFDILVENVIKQIGKDSPLFGIIPKAKSRTKRPNSKKLNTRKPQMFS